MRDEVRELQELGMETVVNLIYSVSPRHTDDYYAQKAREAAAIAPYRICFKDVGGLLTPGARANLAAGDFDRTPAPSRWNITPIATTVWRRSAISRR